MVLGLMGWQPSGSEKAHLAGCGGSLHSCSLVLKVVYFVIDLIWCSLFCNYLNSFPTCESSLRSFLMYIHNILIIFFVCLMMYCPPEKLKFFRNIANLGLCISYLE